MLLLGWLRRSNSNRVKKKEKRNKFYHASEWLFSRRFNATKTALFARNKVYVTKRLNSESTQHVCALIARSLLIFTTEMFHNSTFKVVCIRHKNANLDIGNHKQG